MANLLVKQVPPELLRKVHVAAATNGVTIRAFIVGLLSRELKAIKVKT